MREHFVDCVKECDVQDLISIYIHFPYCLSRCPYCDFFRALKPKCFNDIPLLDEYMAGLDLFAPYVSGRKVKSIFFGGGTPSLLSPCSVEQILKNISSRFTLLSDVEITLEANPNTFEREKFESFRKAGINRLSLGVQALNKEDLKFLGRSHTLDEALKAMEVGAEIFPKFSIDLIYARPEQQWETWQKEVDLALSYGLKHISLYQLSIEEKTVFARQGIRGLEEEQAANLYEQTVLYLRDRGLERYEVSNFAAAGHESVHNMVYWQGGDYLGIGKYAHGRFRVGENIYGSMDGRAIEILMPEERAEELLIMGLRIKEGINAVAFYEACGIHLFSFVNKAALVSLAEKGLLAYNDEGIWLTDAGFLLLDEIVLQLAS